MLFSNLKDWIAGGHFDSIEATWMQAIETLSKKFLAAHAAEGAQAVEGAQAPAADAQIDELLAEMTQVLQSLTDAGKKDTAETLAWTMIAEMSEQAPPQATLRAARAISTAAPAAQELRNQIASLYRALHGKNPLFEALLGASGLGAHQSLRRAIRTLDTCLAIAPGAYMANRFDHGVLRAQKYNDAFGEFELADPAGKTVRIEPKNLADEFDLVDEKDFRVLCQHRQQELGKLLQEDPAAVLVGVCMTRGGKTDSNELKEMLVPSFIPADQWADWWSKARTAAKRNSNLALAGRNPLAISYHPRGQTLEEQFAPALEAARLPLDGMTILQQYIREARQRKQEPQKAFLEPLLATLAEQARAFQHKRPADALVATMALAQAGEMGLAVTIPQYPSPASITEHASEPAGVIAELAETNLWAQALAALAARNDGPPQLAALLRLVPAANLDDVAQKLLDAQAEERIVEAVAAALSSPLGNLELFLWLWKGPVKPTANVPGKVELLTRMMKALQELDHDWQAHPARVKATRARIRAALAASDYASYRQAVSQMDEVIAGTVKRLIERSNGLSATQQAVLLEVLKDSHYRLFAKVKIDPWLDETTIWTTQASLDRREKELKELVEVKMLENARAIGAAAAHGDLSENSEWKFAIEERDMLKARADKMNQELAKSQILRPENVPGDSVGIGSRVTLKRVSDGEEIEVAFLGPWDSDLAKNIFSYQTPLAQDMMGKTVGQTVHGKIGGDESDYRIEKLGSMLE